MAKKSSKKRGATKSSHKSSTKKSQKKPEGPEYMVQITEPKMARKNILESLREVIIFMQGYEKFRTIQNEKVNLFNILKSQVKELDSLVNTKLKKYLPEGKIKPSVKDEKVEVDKKRRLVEERQAVMEEKVAETELNELESQLSDIESQLSKIK